MQARLTILTLCLLGALLLAMRPDEAAALEYYAATNGAGTPGTDWAGAFTNLQDALNAATGSGDLIYLAGHTFAVSNTLRWTNSGVTLRGGYEGVGAPGSNNPSLWPTVIKPSASGAAARYRVLYITNLTAGTMEQVTINGAAGPEGGGIAMWNSTATVAACILRDNAVYGEPNFAARGAGIRAQNCSVTISNCVIAGNVAWYDWGTLGGGVYLLNCASAVLTDCTFTNNSARGWNFNVSPGHGGGVYADNSIVTITNCVLRGNYVGQVTNFSAHGGGVYTLGGRMSMVNCLVISNGFTPGFGIGRGAGMLFDGGTNLVQNCTIVTNTFPTNTISDGIALSNAANVTLKNSIIRDNGDDLVNFPTNAQGTLTNVTFCNIGNGDNNGVNGCISSNPLFVDGVYYHLQSRAQRYAGGYFSGGYWTNDTVSSPSIDAGDPASDYSREPWPNGRRVNLGAYGNTPVASVTYISPGAIIKTF